MHGYIIFRYLGNVPDSKKVRFVRQVTQGVNQSWNFHNLQVHKSIYLGVDNTPHRVEPPIFVHLGLLLALGTQVTI